MALLLHSHAVVMCWRWNLIPPPLSRALTDMSHLGISGGAKGYILVLCLQGK